MFVQHPSLLFKKGARGWIDCVTLYTKLACSFAGVNLNFILISHVTLDIKVSLSVVGVHSNFYFKFGASLWWDSSQFWIYLLGCHFGVILFVALFICINSAVNILSEKSPMFRLFWICLVFHVFRIWLIIFPIMALHFYLGWPLAQRILRMHLWCTRCISFPRK